MLPLLICKIHGEINGLGQDRFVLLSSTNCLCTQRSVGKQMAKSWLLAMKMGMCLFLLKRDFVTVHIFGHKPANAMCNFSWGSPVVVDILIYP